MYLSELRPERMLSEWELTLFMLKWNLDVYIGDIYMFHGHFLWFWAARWGGQSHPGTDGKIGVTLTASLRVSKHTIDWTYKTYVIIVFKWTRKLHENTFCCQQNCSLEAWPANPWVFEKFQKWESWPNFGPLFEFSNFFLQIWSFF